MTDWCHIGGRAGDPCVNIPLAEKKFEHNDFLYCIVYLESPAVGLVVAFFGDLARKILVCP